MKVEKFRRICDGVWRDHAAVLSGRGHLSSEAALVRAVYWRLRKAGGGPEQSIEACDPERMMLVYQRLIGRTLAEYAHPPFDSAALLNELVGRYLSEVGRSR